MWLTHIAERTNNPLATAIIAVAFLGRRDLSPRKNGLLASYDEKAMDWKSLFIQSENKE